MLILTADEANCDTQVYKKQKTKRLIVSDDFKKHENQHQKEGIYEK